MTWSEFQAMKCSIEFMRMSFFLALLNVAELVMSCDIMGKKLFAERLEFLTRVRVRILICDHSY